ncbi:MAG: hypothetical protein FWE42_06115 [Defluviitaleaceae bacterium]|nr:hypothetical protein [Defluviitaleaceae bacterium]
MKKKLISTLLILVFALSTFMLVHASIYEDYNSNIKFEANTIDAQFERLSELQELLWSGDRSTIVPFGDDNLIEPPRINIIAPPPYEGGQFLIGLEVDLGTLGRDDIDAINELTTKDVCEEIIDFILYFTGIPRDSVDIGYSAILRLSPVENYVASDICPVWGNDLPIQPRRETLFMGQRVTVNGSTSTVGHPLNSLGNSFFTTFHRHIPTGTPAYSPHLGGRGVGFVQRTIFNETVDIAQISMAPLNVMISSQLPGGGNISNFRGTSFFGDPVISIRGFSGVQNTTIFSTNAIIPHYGIRNMILVYPVGRITNGDSGAALIRTLNRSVLGTLSGDVIHNGRHVGIYSDVQRY